MGNKINPIAFRLETTKGSPEWLSSWFAGKKKYPQLLLNIPVTIKKDLTSPAIATIIKESEIKLHSGRLVVRYSGTENILRIMIEDNELSHAHYIGSLLSQALQKELSSL